MKCKVCHVEKPARGMFCAGCLEEHLDRLAHAFQEGPAQGIKEMDYMMTFKDKVRYLRSVPLKVNPWFWALVAFLTIPETLSGGLMAGITVALFVLCVFTFVVLHEYGHVWASQRCGIGVDRVLIWPLGGLAMMKANPSTPWDEFKIAIAGPLVNFFFALVSLGLIFLLPKASFLGFIFAINLVLGVFNMIPAFPMDGGRIFRAALWKWTGSLATSTKIAVRVGQVIALAMIPVGIIMLGSFLMPIIGVMIIFAAEAELRNVESRLSEL